MIKIFIDLAKLVIATLVAFIFQSCQFNLDSIGETVNGNGKVVRKERKVNPFTKIEVKKGLECIVTQGKNCQVVVEADSNLQDGIHTTVENGTLVITSDYNNYVNVTKKIHVTMPIVEKLETTSGSELHTEGILKSNFLHLKSSSGSDLYANVSSETIQLESTSGSDITVEGKAIDLTTASSSGSHIDAEKLLANNITSQSTSGSETDVHPILQLKAKASSGSSIHYHHVPKKIAKEESSGGSVNKN